MRGRVYAILTLLAGALALYLAFHVSGEIRAKRDWPTVEGKVLERRLEGGGRPARKIPRVTYEYVVDGVTYRNDQVHLIRDTTGDTRDMQQLIDGIPDRVPVHYDPRDPKQAYLRANSMAWFYILLPVGILLLLIGLVLLVGAKGKP